MFSGFFLMLLGLGSTRARLNPSETEVSRSLLTRSRLDKCFENQEKAHVKLYDFHIRGKPAKCQEFLVAVATRTEVHSVDPQLALSLSLLWNAHT